MQVKLEQGVKIIKIFKDHSSKACILDDFGFYEARQKSILEKKAKQQQFQKQARYALFQNTNLISSFSIYRLLLRIFWTISVVIEAKFCLYFPYLCNTQVWEGKPTEEKKESWNGDTKLQKSFDVATDLSKEPTSTAQANGDVKISENGSVVKTGDAHKGGKPVVTEKVILTNGVANGC